MLGLFITVLFVAVTVNAIVRSVSAGFGLGVFLGVARLAITVVGPRDTAFAEQVGRPLLKPVMALMSRKVRARARKLGVRYSFFFMRADGAQLKTLAAFYDAGTLRPVLDRTFPCDETLDAMAYVEQGRAKGKIVVTMPRASWDSCAAHGI